MILQRHVTVLFAGLSFLHLAGLNGVRNTLPSGLTLARPAAGFANIATMINAANTRMMDPNVLGTS